jgi:mono/diheme cytochrome c family protein
MMVALQTRWRTFLLTLLSASPALFAHGQVGDRPSVEDAIQPSAVPQQLLEQNCFECHANGANEGNFALDDLLGQPANEATSHAWRKVLANLRAGTMPPPDSSQRLSLASVRTLAEWIKFEAMGLDRDHPDPGRITLRRLNRREYANTIRELFGIDFNADVIFPPDDTGYGFDNVGDALSLSPMVVEKYLAAASQIVEQAVPKVNLVPPEQRFTARDIQGDDGRNADNMRLNRSHRVKRAFEVRHQGRYAIEVVLKSGGSFESSPQRAVLKCNLDGESLLEKEVGWDESKRDTRTWEFDWEPSQHELVFELTPIELDEPPKNDWFADLDIESITIRGPFDRSYWKHPPGYDRIFTRDQAPEDSDARAEYVREVFYRLGERIFRRPIAPGTLDRLVTIVHEAEQQPDTTFEAAVAQAIIPMLASPRFLFRIEETVQPPSDDPFPLVDEYSLASRLSYFLWSTMPDEALLELARTNRLREQLQPTVERMLADPRAKSLVENFAGQWLRTRDVEKTSIDPIAVYGLQSEFEERLAWIRKNRQPRRPGADAPADPEADAMRARFQELRKIQDMWNADVRNAMRRETEMLFACIVTENRDIADLIDPGFTFLNERLANHYGIPDVKGSEMRRVALSPDSPRGGILTHGTMLAVTSNPTRTSPVKRGLYILENILGTPAPPAPPNVPALEDAAKHFPGREPSLKELLASHRDAPLCASCHARWRTSTPWGYGEIKTNNNRSMRQAN